MAPHCDSLDGPVARAAQQALDAANVAFVLPFVPKSRRTEIIETFERMMAARQANATCRESGTPAHGVVLLHRAGYPKEVMIDTLT